MAHFGMLVPPFLGHLRPTLVLAEALRGRGHQVTILSFADGVARVTAPGITAVAFGHRLFPPGEWNRRVEVMGEKEGRAVFRTALELLVDQARSITEDLASILSRLALDGLVMDQLCYTAESVAEALQIPLAVACNALPFHREGPIPLCHRPWAFNRAWWARARNRLDGGYNLLLGWRMSIIYVRHRRALGLRLPRLSDLNEVPPSLVQIAQLPPFLDFPRRALPAHFRYTGPWLQPEGAGSQEFPWERLDGRPLVYASLGTLQNGVDWVYRVMAEACRDLPVQLVIGLGRETEREFGGWPGDPVIVRFAPQRALLKRACLNITHAGLNSVLEALSEGVPMIALPQAHDQPGVAARVRHLGAGLVIPRSRLTAVSLREAVGAGLQDQAMRRCVLHCAKALAAIDGPGQAAALLESALLGRKNLRSGWNLAGHGDGGALYSAPFSANSAAANDERS